MQVFYLILSLSILVILHEFGHYITARWFKCRVEKFYLFFDPWFSIVKKKVGDTEYGIGWLPLGGYVKIAGMVDESMDTEAMKLPPKPYEFRSKPAWQRLIIMLGGIIVNILLAFVIYGMVLFIWGEEKVPNATVSNGIWCTDTLMIKSGGLENGDKIVAINGQKVNYFDDITSLLILNGGKSIEVNRNGVDTNIQLPIDLIGQLSKVKRTNTSLIIPRVPAIVGEFAKDDTSNAARAGIKYNDIIVMLDSTPISFMDQIGTYLQAKKNQQVAVTVIRGQQALHLTSKVDGDGKLGIALLSPDQYDSMGVYKLQKTKYSFFAAIPAGVGMTFEKLGNYVDQFKLILNPKTGGAKGIGGFKTIASVFPTAWGDWEGFWRITAFLSIILAFMNLLPIPALDGGHVLFTLVEMITGRKPSEKFLEYAQVVGMVLLFALMIYANGNDWFGWGRR